MKRKIFTTITLITMIVTFYYFYTNKKTEIYLYYNKSGDSFCNFVRSNKDSTLIEKITINYPTENDISFDSFIIDTSKIWKSDINYLNNKIIVSQSFVYTNNRFLRRNKINSLKVKINFIIVKNDSVLIYPVKHLEYGSIYSDWPYL